MEIADIRLDGTLREFLKFNPQRVLEILEQSGGQKRGSLSQLDIEMRMRELSRTLTKHCKDLKDIFQHYSAGEIGGSASAMDCDEFLDFIRDCQLTDQRVTASDLDQIFGFSMGIKGKVPSDREMVASEFSEALIRIAEKKFPMLPFHERLRELLEGYVLPNASRSECDKFREELCRPEVLAVYKKHSAALKRIFRYYAAMRGAHTDDRNNHAFIDIKAFFTLAKDCKLLGSCFTEETLKQIFLNIQSQDEDVADNDADSMVDFSEYQEAIAAMTEYSVCSPYLPLYKRIDTFISETFLPRARQMKVQ